MPGGIYIVSAITSLACAFLLYRGWRTTSVRLLFWSSLCFLGLTIDNLLLYVDTTVIPETHLYSAPSIAGLISVTLLLYGLIWDGT